MSRRITTFLLALMLSCYGFAVFAHGVAGVNAAVEQGTTCMAEEELLALADDPTDPSDDALSHDEAGSEHFELVGALPMPATSLFRSEQPPRMAQPPVLTPFLQRPKRPPRAAALSV